MAEATGQMGQGGIDSDDQVHLLHITGRLREIAEARRQINDFVGERFVLHRVTVKLEAIEFNPLKGEQRGQFSNRHGPFPIR